MEDNKNLPAFPDTMRAAPQSYLNQNPEDWPTGLTKLEFIACNAPCDIPWWFEHVPPIKNLSKRFGLEDINNEEDRKVVKDWEYDPIYDLPDHLQWYSDRIALINKENKVYEHENNVARYFQWRRFYAENLLAELSKS